MKEGNMTRIALVISILCVTQQDTVEDRLSGHWRGYWLRAGDTMAVAMDIRRDAATSRYTATFDAERLRVTGIPFADVGLEGCCNVTLTLRGDRTTTTFTGRLRGDSLSGAFRDSDGEGRFAFVRERSGGAVVEKEITFQNGSATLSGSLLMPQRGGALTAVVFLHGSGGEGRWASRFLALQLVQQGVAALIFDKRGVGKSTGDWRTANVDDLVGDAVAAVARLRQEPRINARSIGIHGHSQGGTLAPMVTVRSNQVGFVIASAAAGTPTDSTEIFSVLNSVYPRATTAEDSAAARDYVSELVAVAYHGESRQQLDVLTQELRGRSWFFAPPAPDNS